MTTKHAWDQAMPVLWVVAVAVLVWVARPSVHRNNASGLRRGRLIRYIMLSAIGSALFAGFAVNVDLVLPHERGGLWHWLLAALFAAGLAAVVSAATWMIWIDAGDDGTDPADPAGLRLPRS